MFTYLVSLSVEGVFESDNIGVEELFHYLKLSVFVPLVLVNFLDGNYFSSFSDVGLHNSN